MAIHAVDQPVARAVAADLVAEVAELAGRIASVPAPTFAEAERARLVAALLAERDLRQVEIDELHNVVGRIPGRNRAPALLLAAHLDTVFPAETPITIRREGDRLYGPGIGDNSVGVASLVVLADALRRLDLVPAVDLIVTGNVGEEGLGDPRGIRAVMNANPDIGAAVAIEGHALGRITYQAVGSRRYRIRAFGPGGHSWGDAGRPSAIHALARLVARLDSLPLSDAPKTTLNVGLFQGGISVNTIAPEATIVVDLRSVSAPALRELAERVEGIVAATSTDEIRLEMEVVGDRPAGEMPLDHGLVPIARETLLGLGINPVCDASSTDANVPISRGVPAICIGLTTGGNVHRPDEFINLGPLADGLAQLLLLVTMVADHLAAGRLRREPRPTTRAAD